MARLLALACLCLLAVAVLAAAGGVAAVDGTPGSVPTADSNHGQAILQNDTTDQPGDVVTIPVGLAGNETEATVVVGGEDAGYRLVVRVVDANRDGVVSLRWNTYHAGVVGADAVANRTVSAADPDRVVEARRTTPERDSHLPEGEYAVEVRHGNSTVATDRVILESDPLRRATITVLEGPPLADPAAALARSGISDTVERDEWLFVVVERPSIHGYVDGIGDLTRNGTEGVTFRLNRTADGEPADLSNATFLHYPEHDEFVVGVPPNATALDADTDYVAEFVVERSNPYSAARITASTSVRVLPAGAEPDRAVLEVAGVSAPDTVIEGRNATFQVSVVNRGEREGTTTIVLAADGERATRAVTVGPRAQETVAVEFDTAPLTEGTSRWTVSVEGGVRNLSGTIDVRLTNETPNTDPTLVPGTRREADGGQPGFGALAGLAGVALGVGGRLLATRKT